MFTNFMNVANTFSVLLLTIFTNILTVNNKAMQNEMVCPACKKRNRNTKLLLKQINFENAVYLCPLTKCKYPKGYPWLVVKRTFDELTDLVCEKKQLDKEREKETTENNAFLQDLLSPNPQDDTDEFINVLNDLNNISVNNMNNTNENIQPENTTVETVATIQPESLDILADINTQNEEKNDSFSILENTDLFSTSVNEILSEFMTGPPEETQKSDFNIDDFLLDDILQF